MPTLCLRRSRQDDLDFILAAEQHPENCRYVYQWTREQHQAALASSEQAHFVLSISEDNHLAGYLIFDELTNPSRSINLRRLVITEKGRGYGRQALQLALELAFNQLNAHRVWLDVFTDNQRAYHLYRKVGFKEEGCLRQSYLRPDGYASQYIMAYLKDEYLAVLLAK